MLEQVPILRLRAESLSESTCEAIEKGHCRNLESIHLNHRLPTTPGDQPPDATDIVILKKDQS